MTIFQVGDYVLVSDYISLKINWIRDTIDKKIGPRTYIFFPELNTKWHRHLNQILEIKVNDNIGVSNNLKNVITTDNGNASFIDSDSINLREEK